MITIPEIVIDGKSLSIQRFVPWTIDFDFLINKASKDLERAYTDEIRYFMEHTINLSVTLDSIVDYVWHTIILPKGGSGFKTDSKYKAWLTENHMYPHIFSDFSNTFKHFDRKFPNKSGQGLGLAIFNDSSPELSDEDELDNILRCDIVRDGKTEKLMLSPRIVFDDQRNSIPLRVIAKNTIAWWKEYYASIV